MNEQHRNSDGEPMVEESGINRDNKNNNLTLYVILSVGLILRWVHLTIVSGSDLVQLPIIDSAFYHTWATLISQGDVAGTNIFFMSPLYPYLMGFIYSIVGAKPVWVMAIQGLMGVGTLWLLYRFGERLAGKTVGLIAAAIGAVYAPFIFYDSTLLTSSLILFLSAAILNLTYSVLTTERAPYLWMLGIALALSALTRPLVFIFVPFILVGMFLQNRSSVVKRSVTLAIAMSILLFPVGIRNLIVGGEFVLTTSSAGMNLYVGNNPDAHGLYWEAPFLSSAEPQYENEDYRIEASRQADKNLTTRQAGQHWTRQSLSWIVNNPIDYIILEWRKLFYFWNRTEFANNVSIYFAKDVSSLLRMNPFGFWLIAPIGLSGLIWMGIKLGWQRMRVAYLWVLAYLIGCMMFFVSSEYRLPIMLPLMVGAGFLLKELYERFKSRQTDELFRLIILGLVFFPFMNFRTDFIREGDNARMDWFNMGNTLIKHYRYADAVPRLKRSLEIDPYFAEGYHKLAEAYYRSGDIDNALAIGKKVGLSDEKGILRIIRGESVYEAFALLNEGNFYAAFQEFLFAGWDSTRAVAETTRVGRLRDAQLAFTQGDFETSLNLFRLINANDSIMNPVIGYNIAMHHWKFGDPDSTEYYLEKTLEVDSVNVPAVQLLSLVYDATGREDKSIQILRRISPAAVLEDQVLPNIRIEMDSLASLGLWDEALKAYARYARKHYPEALPEDNFRLGRLQLEVGNSDLALRLLEDAEDAGITGANLYLYKGRAFAELDRTGEAIAALQRAISEIPDLVEARIVLGQLYLAQGKYESAWKETEALVYLKIEDPVWRDKYQQLRKQLQK